MFSSLSSSSSELEEPISANANLPSHLDPHPLMKEWLESPRKFELMESAVLSKCLEPTLCHHQTVAVVLPSLLDCLLYVFALQSIYLSSKDESFDYGIVRTCICPTWHLFAYL